MNQEKIGKFISEKRKEKNLTQAQLAEKIGVSVNAVSKWERGLNLPDASIMLELCDTLDISVNDLLNGEKLTPEEQKHKSDINAISILTTKKEVEKVKLLTEILIIAGIIVAMTLSRIFATTVIQEIVTHIVGWFIWGYGIFMRIKLKNTSEKISE
jgi:transcriptional regulator with XRE-family HTH domain